MLCTRTITLLLIFWSYFPLIICNAISCQLDNLITVRGISTKLHTFVKHIQTTCHAQVPLLLYVYVPLASVRGSVRHKIEPAL